MEQETVILNGTPEQNELALKEMITLLESGYTLDEVKSAIKEMFGGEANV